MPDPITAITGGSAILGAASANKAANAQTAAAKKDIAFQRETRDQIVAKLNPYYQGGVTAQNALMYEMGLAPRPTIGGNTLSVTEVAGKPGLSMGNFSGGGTPSTFKVGDRTFATRAEAQAYADANSTQGTPYAGFQASPGYQFALDQGNASINALAGAKGGLMSGATLQALQNNGINMANQEYGNWLTRLSGVAGSGQNAAAAQGTAMSGAAQNISGAYGAIGNAQAAGARGVYDAFNSGAQNYLGYQQYQQGLARPQTAIQPFFGGGR